MVDQWVEWAAYNLALGVAEAKVGAEMVEGGLSPSEAEGAINEIKASIVYAAARKLAREVKKWNALADALVALESQSGNFSRIPRVSNLSSSEFLDHYYAANRPVIVTDVVSKWPAVSKWTLDFLRERFGAEEVTYQCGRSAADHRDSFIDHSVTGTLGDYIDLVARGDGTNANYLIAHDRLLDRPKFKALLKDIVFDDRYFDSATDGRVFFWLGSAGTMTPMHRDLGNVYFAQIAGRKIIKMIPSKQMHLVYNESGYHSEADFEDLSYVDYPRLKSAHIMEEIVMPGELLFIPLGWWHHVRAMDLSITITGNNFRFPNGFSAIF